jgi:putative oxidoreductase
MLHVAYTLGRICVPIVFIAAGIHKALNVGDVARMLAANKVPVPDEVVAYLGGMPKYEALGYFVAAIEIICGLMVLTGIKARWGALVLIVFTACTIVFVHHFWDMEGLAAAQNRTEALKNLSIMGALLLIVAGGAGERSNDERRVA